MSEVTLQWVFIHFIHIVYMFCCANKSSEKTTIMACRVLIRRKQRLLMLFWLPQFQYVARSMWVHPLNNLRFEKGEFYTHYPDLRHSPTKFFTMYSMNVPKFDNLLLRIVPHISPKRNNWRHCISAEQKLVITLRYSIPIRIL